VTDGYDPPPRPFTAPDLPIWVGARGEGFNRFASKAADGVFVGGIPLPILETVVGWARSERSIDVGIYVGAVFDPDEVEAVRPRLVFSLLDAPDINRERLGVSLDDARAAAAAFSAGDDRPARRLIDDRVLDQLLLRGSTSDVGRRLRAIVDRLSPTSIGVALLTPDLERGLDHAAQALAIARNPASEEVPA